MFLREMCHPPGPKKKKKKRSKKTKRGELCAGRKVCTRPLKQEAREKKKEISAKKGEDGKEKSASVRAPQGVLRIEGHAEHDQFKAFGGGFRPA